MACLRLLTRPPLPPLPRFRLPFFLRCTARLTSLLALLEYFRAIGSSCCDAQRATGLRVPENKTLLAYKGNSRNALKGPGKGRKVFETLARQQARADDAITRSA